MQSWNEINPLSNLILFKINFDKKMVSIFQSEYRNYYLIMIEFWTEELMQKPPDFKIFGCIYIGMLYRNVINFEWNMFMFNVMFLNSQLWRNKYAILFKS